MLLDGGLHRFEITLLQNRLAPSTGFGLQTFDATFSITVNPVMNRHLTNAHNLCNLARSAPLTLEQNHLAASPKCWTGAIAMTFFERNARRCAQLDNSNFWHQT
jgi:hypothetical protein